MVSNKPPHHPWNKAMMMRECFHQARAVPLLVVARSCLMPAHSANPPLKRRVRPRTTAVEVGEKISVIKVGTTTTSSLSGRSRCSSPVMVRDSRQKPLVPISIGANVSGCHFPQISGISSSANELDTYPHSKYIWPIIPQISGLTVLITINIWGSHTVFPIYGIGHLLHVACVTIMYRATGLVG